MGNENYGKPTQTSSNNYLISIFEPYTLENFNYIFEGWYEQSKTLWINKIKVKLLLFRR